MDVSRTIQPQVPAGTSLVYRGGVVPFGYLLEDGSLHEPGAYPRLFEAIGYTYGQVGTKFRLPKSFGTTDIGAGQGTGLTNRVLGQTGGAETHQLTEGEMPSHTHEQNPHGHGITDPGHSHNNNLAAPGSAGNFIAGGGGDDLGTRNTQVATTGISINNSAGTNKNTGGSQAHNNMQPFLVATKMIKF